MSTVPFRDRTEAAETLARLVDEYRGRGDVVVMALPRGGVPVGAVLAERLQVPLDVFLVRKLGVPTQEELAFGAVAAGGTRVLNHKLIEDIGLAPSLIERITRRELEELERRERLYRAGLAPVDLQGRTVLLVDDGLATGATMLACARAARLLGARQVVVAVPVASSEACRLLREEGARVIAAATPEPFRAVGLWYENFDQTTDQEVRELLENARANRPHPAGRP